MKDVVLFPDSDREELFRATGAKRAMAPGVVEKDFWVCWVLKGLFEHPDTKSNLLFKGGTSLSKVFGLIDRFSEDIDLILNWDMLTEEDPHAERSKNKQLVFNTDLNAKAVDYIQNDLYALLGEVLAPCKVTRVEEDQHKLRVEYPKTYSEEYLKPEVLLEIGPLASWIPHDEFAIKPYAAEEYPGLFAVPEIAVKAIKAERTFWEKVTILHQEAHRPDDNPQPAGYSRHYYDVVRIAATQIKDNALADAKLRDDVVAFKSKFYARKWARYDLAMPGSFKLVPPDHVRASTEKDYKDMEVMIYGDRPPFQELMSAVEDLEKEINAG